MGLQESDTALQESSLPAEPQGKPKNTGVGSLSLLQGVFPTQELNQGLLHCRWSLYQLNYQGSPLISYTTKQNKTKNQQQQKMKLAVQWGKKVKVLVAYSCPTLYNPMGYNPPRPSVYGILQARIWSGFPFPSPGDLPNPGNEPRSLALQADSLPCEPPEAVSVQCD